MTETNENGGEVIQMRDTPVAAMNSLTLLEFSNARWRLNVQPGVTHQDLVDPAFYSVVSGKLRPFDIVECVSDTFWAEILIRSAERGAPVQAVGLRYVDLPELVRGQHGDVPPNHDVRYDPTDGTYQGIRLSDNVPLTPKLHDRTLELRELQDHATLREPTVRRWHDPFPR
ncbi:MAG: hypothetical protein IT488_10475 [Gammaproteobacteria bacterium]|nr:hypothetical protein [Gammaproteobacteria bacterium]